MTALAARPHQTSRRTSALLVIAAAHFAVLYIVFTSTQVRAMLRAPAIQASIIDLQMPEAEAPPPPAPKLETPDPPTMDPPLITLADEPPPPTAITVAVNESPAPPRVEAAPRVITNIAYVEPPRPQYPAESRRSGEEGLVVLHVLIDERGHVVNVEVQRSSGFARLDAAARRAVEHAQFRPYVENGVPRQALAVVPIEFAWKSHAASNSRRS